MDSASGDAPYSMEEGRRAGDETGHVSFRVTPDPGAVSVAEGAADAHSKEMETSATETFVVRLARLETGLKVAGGATVLGVAMLAIVMTVVVFQVQDTKDQIRDLRAEIRSEIGALRTDMAEQSRTLRSELAAEARATRQELSGIATAIATGITAARQPPAPIPQAPSTAPPSRR